MASGRLFVEKKAQFHRCLGFAVTKSQVMVIQVMRHERLYDTLTTGRQYSSTYKATRKLTTSSGTLHLIVYVTRSRRGGSLSGRSFLVAGPTPLLLINMLSVPQSTPLNAQDLGKVFLHLKFHAQFEGQNLAGPDFHIKQLTQDRSASIYEHSEERLVIHGVVSGPLRI
jgi:hypothetical protein